ncbi:histidine kinase [Pseudomonas syringae]|uniref:Histidine kinase n=2 Tax=Pseudomonas syringae TaxID=317 RepID=A0A085VQT4_PSESX|nr:histidine kinase [Pseudomonas syringae]
MIHLDYSVLSALQEVMEDEYPSLLDVFLNDSELRVARMRQFMCGPAFDLQELSMMAHSFKGSSSNMGALQLAALCHQLEERSRRGEVVGIEDLLISIDMEYSTVRRLFDAERQLFIAQP